MNRKTTIAISIILALLCIGGISVFLVLKNLPVPDPVVNIYTDGRLYRTERLSAECEFTVTTEYGSNTIRIADGKVSVISADCPDRICVHSGAISDGAVPIICLPHRLEIWIASAKDDGFDIQIK